MAPLRVLLFQELITIVFILLLLFLRDTEAAAAVSMAKRGCQETCGNVSIPYPFGIGRDCYRDEGFEINCTYTSNNSVPFNSLGQQVQQFSLDYVRVISGAVVNCYNTTTGMGEWVEIFTSDWSLNPFTFSNTRNKFAAIGCDIFAYIPTSSFNSQNYTSGCAALCGNETVDVPSSCSGNGCCQTTIPTGLKSWKMRINSINTVNRSWIPNPCSFAFLVDKDFSDFYIFNLSSIAYRHSFWTDDFKIPLVLDWAIGNITCNEAIGNSTSYACGNNSHCSNSTNGPGYNCNCNRGYQGNPYLPQGCLDIDECKDSKKNLCRKEAHCINTQGSYFCSCPTGYQGDGRFRGSGCTHDKRKLPVVVVVLLGFGISIGLIILLAIGCWMYHRLEKRKQMNLKQKFFKRNGGLLLKQQISTEDGSVEKAKIFVTEELERATDNFNQSRVLGKGGFGTVYKGMLSDGKIVAIKKSVLVDESQVSQFINEVAILSQINHKHIVKLLGCCLETQVPLLIYEYVSNGTLFHHLHDESHMSSLSWENRLRIASEIAGALAYLHSATSIPIFHRDIKSSNILLDENFRAKVSDFGLSRSVPIDKTHLTTVVQGTFGYLDPEYFHSSQFTEKSDVYSFGVVLVELITGERAVSFGRSEEGKNLAMYFISSIKENRLFEVLETRVVNEGDKEELMAVAKLAKRCLKLNGKKRPTMKEVASDLDRLRGFQEHPWVGQKNQKDECLLGETSSCYTGGTIGETSSCYTGGTIGETSSCYTDSTIGLESFGTTVSTTN